MEEHDTTGLSGLDEPHVSVGGLLGRHFGDGTVRKDEVQRKGHLPMGFSGVHVDQ
jgi:hypothetical protein